VENEDGKLMVARSVGDPQPTTYRVSTPVAGWNTKLIPSQQAALIHGECRRLAGRRGGVHAEELAGAVLHPGHNTLIDGH